MSLPNLPLVPFATLPYKRWRKNQEKKPRVEIVDDRPQRNLEEFSEANVFRRYEEFLNGASSRRSSAVPNDRSEAMSAMSTMSRSRMSEGSQGSSRSGLLSAAMETPSGTSRSALITTSRQESVSSRSARRRGSATSTGSGSDRRSVRSRSDAFSQAYSAGMSEPDSDEEEDDEENLTKREKLRQLYLELKEDKEISRLTIAMEVGFFNYIRFSREVERKNRMNHILLEYEQKVADYYRRIQEELNKEVKDDEAELRAHVKRMELIRKGYNHREMRRKFVEIENDRKTEKYDAKANLIKYYCDHLHDWAIEHHQVKVDQKRLEAERAALRKKQEEERQVEERRQRRVAHEMKIIEDDRAMTQDVLQIMRKSGTITAVNVADKGVVMKKKDTKIASEVLELHLRDGIDFTNWRKSGRKHGHGQGHGGLGGDDIDEDSDEFFQPFAVDLSTKSGMIRMLQCYAIGERGAMCLAAEFVKGACPYLEVLNLSRCEIQTRGFSKVLHGLRIGRLKSISSLDLRGNHLTPRALEYLKLAIEDGAFDALLNLDLRDNELGNEGAHTIVRLFISGVFDTLRELHLQRNGIADDGFAAIVKLLRFLKPQKCPDLVRIGLEGNHISAQIKQELAPLPPYISV